MRRTVWRWTYALAACGLTLALAGQPSWSADGKAGGKKKGKKAANAAAKTDPAATQFAPVNLALHRPATASSADGDGYAASAATDGDEGSRWSAADGSYPQWLQVDLGDPQDLTGCSVLWEHATVPYRHRVEGSADGKAWRMLADNANRPSTAREQSSPFTRPGETQPPPEASGVRFVRVTVLAGSPTARASIAELEVYGTKTAPVDPSAKKGRVFVGGPPKVVAPPGWEVSIFATPPAITYPVCVCAAPNGDVFVGTDEMGTMGSDTGRGRVWRLRDTDGDGKADQIEAILNIDHPRGIWADGRDLYIVHPPQLTRYTDADGDGTYETSKTLVEGTMPAELGKHAADHTSNGVRMGPDGWLYIAMGDFGVTHAVGADGSVLRQNAGGVIRVRPDGSGLESYSFGQRNIFDTAIDPFAHVFTRDNTNDGGGWNSRLSYVVPSGNYGYPRLFLRFGEDIIPALADYGGGAPSGMLWVDEPGMPPIASGLLSVEWGASKVFHHPLKAEGAGYAKDVPQERFLDLQRPTDIDYDGVGHFFVTSWSNGAYNYSGDDVGYVARVTPPGLKPQPFPNVTKLSSDELLKQLLSPSMSARQAAQRELIRRGPAAGLDTKLIEIARSPQSPASGRSLAAFTLKILFGERANGALVELSHDPALRETALRALLDKKLDASVPVNVLIASLSDEDPRVRLVAAWGIGRRFATDETKSDGVAATNDPDRARAIDALMPLAGDADPLVQHLASQSIARLDAAPVALAKLATADERTRAGLLRALQQLHEDVVVKGLAAAAKSSNDAASKAAVYRALCRLYFTEGPWDGSWWGTRPDTSGPYYRPAEWSGTPQVRAALDYALATEDSGVVRQLVIDMQRNKISSPLATKVIADAARSDPQFRAMLLEQLSAGSAAPTTDQVSLLRQWADDTALSSAERISAVRTLAKDPKDRVSLAATFDTLASWLAKPSGVADIEAQLRESLADARYAQQLPQIAALAGGKDANLRDLGYAFYLSIAGGNLAKPEQKKTAAAAINAGWQQPVSSASLLRVIGRLGAGEYRDQVQARLADADPAVAAAAKDAAGRLGSATTAVTGPTIDTLDSDTVVTRVADLKGDSAAGQALFTKLGCVGCHTVAASEPPKGPYLGGISARYSRQQLAQSVLKPSATIAQGFESQWFKVKGQEDEPIDGFVTREGGDDLELRNAAGISQTIRKSDIVARGKRDTSIMPEGLLAKSTPTDLANLLAYLESLKK